jgi:hypothetical protein
MLKLYYKIWVDAIVTAKSTKTESKNWRIITIIPISLLQGVNLFTIFYWVKAVFNRNLPLFIGVEIFHADAINSFISIIATFFVPFVILNYLLIFNNDRYKELMTTYKDDGGKPYKKYILLTLGVAIIPVVIKVMFFS